jgi:hypothetical protein
MRDFEIAILDQSDIIFISIVKETINMFCQNDDSETIKKKKNTFSKT